MFSEYCHAVAPFAYASHRGSVLIPSIDKSMEGPGHRFKYIRWGTLLPLDVVSKKETMSQAPAFLNYSSVICIPSCIHPFHP